MKNKINFPKIIHLQWHLTERCNLSCKHCYQSSLTEELNEKELLSVLDNFVRQVGIWGGTRRASISFTGGEPFLKDELFLLLEKCSNLNKKFSYGILTNGTLLDEKKVDKLKRLKVDYVQISIEGGRRVNDQIRGAGSFKKIIDACELIKSRNLNLILGFTVNKINLNDLPIVAEIARKYDCVLSLKRMVPLGRGNDMAEKLLSISQMRDVWKRALIMRFEKKIKISFGCESAIILRDFPEERISTCNAGYGIITLMPNGNIYPCRKLPITVGNVMENSFSEIYNSKTYQKLRNTGRICKNCQSCDYFKKCQGGSRCMAFNYFNNDTAPDPYCWSLFKKLPSEDKEWKEGENYNLKKWWANTGWGD